MQQPGGEATASGSQGPRALLEVCIHQYLYVSVRIDIFLYALV